MEHRYDKRAEELTNLRLARLVTDQSFSFQPLNGTQESAAASPRQRLVNASYLLAIATATFGWLWLIVWCAMELI
jgi:hypothetical protein